MLPDALGVVTVDLYEGQTHSWAIGVRLFGRPGQLHLDTDPHGRVVIRRIGPEDTWSVHGPAGSMTAWEAVQRGLS